MNVRAFLTSMAGRFLSLGISLFFFTCAAATFFDERSWTLPVFAGLIMIAVTLAIVGCGLGMGPHPREVALILATLPLGLLFLFLVALLSIEKGLTSLAWVGLLLGVGFLVLGALPGKAGESAQRGY